MVLQTNWENDMKTKTNKIIVFITFFIVINASYSQEIKLQYIDSLTFSKKDSLVESLKDNYEMLKYKKFQFESLIWEDSLQKSQVQTSQNRLIVVRESKYEIFPIKIYLNDTALVIPKNMKEYPDFFLLPIFLNAVFMYIPIKGKNL